MNETVNEELIRWQKELYTREMSIEMDKLFFTLQSWKNKECNVFEASDKVHEFYKGKSKELFVKYERASFADLNIASAIISGVVSIEELSEELGVIISKKVEILKR